MRKRKQYDDDDGKVIANMNVDGMPWYLDKLHEKEKDSKAEAYQMSKKESRAYLWGVLSASLLVTAVFGLVFAAIILFLLSVWT